MNFFKIIMLFVCFFVFNCMSKDISTASDQESVELDKSKQYLTVLGIAQDAGYPHIDCFKDCCQVFYDGNESKKLVSCLGLVDLKGNKKYMFDATPNFTEQSRYLTEYHLDNGHIIDGIFLTHAHIGHYTGLMYLGFEALGAEKVPVYMMPRMRQYIENNGPWSQLVSYNNIDIHKMKNDSVMSLDSGIQITPLVVPHRDEFSETVGFRIQGSKKAALFIPDIDKWERWQLDIVEEVKKVDYAFLDASFFKDGELDRDMSRIPHPFTTETTTLFENETIETKNKVIFIHFNHLNPTIRKSHHLKDSILNLGFKFAKQGDVFNL